MILLRFFEGRGELMEPFFRGGGGIVARRVIAGADVIDVVRAGERAFQSRWRLRIWHSGDGSRLIGGSL